MSKPVSALRIDVNGGLDFVTLTDLKSWWDVVGGYVEMVQFGDSQLRLMCDEDGKAKGLKPNLLVTEMCRRLNVGLQPNDYIAGPAVIVGQVDCDGGLEDLSPDLLASFRSTVFSMLPAMLCEALVHHAG